MRITALRGVCLTLALSGCSADEPKPKDSDAGDRTADSDTDPVTDTDSDTPEDTDDTDPPTAGYRAISAGEKLTCVLDEVGEAHCFSSSNFTFPAPPSGPFVDIAAGWATACVVGEDGAIDCWGCDWIDGPCTDIPAGNNWVSVEGAQDYFCAQDDQGKVKCWGQNLGFQTPQTVYVDYAVGITGFIGIKANGNADGDAETADVDVPATMVGAGRSQACVVGLADGVTHCWWMPGAEPPNSGVVALDSFDSEMCWIDDQGHVGCVNDMPTVADGFDPAVEVFTSVSAGQEHACGLTEDGHGYCWPANGRVETSVPSWPL